MSALCLLVNVVPEGFRETAGGPKALWVRCELQSDLVNETSGFRKDKTV